MSDNHHRAAQEPLLVNEIFNSIQGEGAFQGMPATFVRLQGCTVGCSWCDTKHTWNAKQNKVIPIQDMSEKKGSRPQSTYCKIIPIDLCEVLERVGNESRNWLVVVTGGEPLEQSDALAEFFRQLCNFRRQPRYIQIETSGCGVMDYYNNRSRFNHSLHFTLSPKIGVGRHDTPLCHATDAFDSLNLPIERESDVQKFGPVLERHPSAKVFVQPVDGAPGSVEACIRLARMYGWTVSTQIHKYLHLR